MSTPDNTLIGPEGFAAVVPPTGEPAEGDVGIPDQGAHTAWRHLWHTATRGIAREIALTKTLRAGIRQVGRI